MKYIRISQISKNYSLKIKKLIKRDLAPTAWQTFEKINTILPGFKCDWNAERGAQQLLNLFQQIDMTEDTFLFRGFTRLKQLEYLIRTQQLDQNFFGIAKN